MSEKENKETTRKVFEEYNALKGDISRLNAWVDKYHAPEIIYHTTSQGDMNFEQVKQMYAEITSAFAPVFTLKQLIAEGDIVVSHISFSGTHQGMYMGIPSTGKKVEFEGTFITKLHGMKAEEEWAFLDTIGLMRQLGVIPGPVPVK
jgi:predicted ester cyclase